MLLYTAVPVLFASSNHANPLSYPAHLSIVPIPKRPPVPFAPKISSTPPAPHLTHTICLSYPSLIPHLPLYGISLTPSVPPLHSHAVCPTFHSRTICLTLYSHTKWPILYSRHLLSHPSLTPPAQHLIHTTLSLFISVYTLHVWTINDVGTSVSGTHVNSPPPLHNTTSLHIIFISSSHFHCRGESEGWED